jgi:hypothetical protein
MGILRSVVLFIVLFFSSVSFAGVENDKYVLPSCGLENGIVVASGEICPDDIYLQFLLSIFPEHLKIFVLPKHLDYAVELVTQSDKYIPKYVVEEMFANISDIIVEIVRALAVMIFFISAFPVFMHFAKTGTFPKEYSKFSFFTIPVGVYGLLPAGNFTIIQTAFLSVVIYAVSFANYAFSLLLHVYHEENIKMTNYTGQSEEISKIQLDEFKHNETYAYHYVEALTKAMLCKNQTNLHQNLIEVVALNSFNRGSVEDKLYIENGKRLSDSRYDDETFINLTDKLIDYDMRVVNGVVFGKPNTDKKMRSVYEYDCGSINTVISQVKDTEFSKIAVPAGLFTSIEETASQIKHYTEEGVQNAVQNGAKSLRESIISEMGIENINTINDEHKKILKQASLVYHQQILSSVMIGYGQNPNGRLIKDYSTVFNKSLAQAEALSRAIRERECLNNRELVDNSLRAYRAIQDGRRRNSISTACLDVSDKGVVGVLGSINNESSYKDRVELFKRKGQVAKEIEALRVAFINDIKAIRTAIEKSYIIDVFEIENKSPYFAQLRQEGFAIYGSEILNLLNSQSSDNASKYALRNTVNTNMESIGETFVAVGGDVEVSSLFPNFSILFKDVFAGVKVDKNNLMYTDFSGYLETMIDDRSQLATAGIGFDNYLMSLISSPFKRYVATFEIENDCDGNWTCRARTENPITKLVSLGNDLIAVSSTMAIAKFLLSFDTGKKDRLNGKFKKGKYGKGLANAAKSFGKGVKDMSFAMISIFVGILAGVALAGLMMIFIGIAIPILFTMSIVTFTIYLLTFFMSVPFAMLRLIQFTTKREILNTGALLTKIGSTFFLYLTLLLLGSMFSLSILMISFVYISHMIIALSGGMTFADAGLIEIFLLAIVYMLTGFLGVYVVLKNVRMSNDLPHKSNNSFIHIEDKEQSFVDNMKGAAAALYYGVEKAAKEHSFERKEFKNSKLREKMAREQKEKESQEKDNKNKGKS